MALAAWSGCGEDPALGGNTQGDTGTDTGTETGQESGELDAMEQRIAELAAIQCAHIRDCDCAIASETCEDSTSDKWQARVEAGVARGLTLDEGCMDATRASIELQECYWPRSRIGPVCEQFCAAYHGTQPLGAACSAYDAQVSDCVQGLTCHDGACAQPCEVLLGLGAGETCSLEFSAPFDDCASGLLCDWNAQVCIAGAGAGEPCFNSQCAQGLWCDWQDDRCRPRGAEGESCQSSQCQDELWCDWKSDVCRHRGSLGDSCGAVPCEDGLLCNMSLTCTNLPVVGQACAQGQCEKGAQCDFENNVCASLPEVGATCLFGECASESWCDRSDVAQPEGTCAERLANGEACSGHGQCLDGYCPRGYCEVRPLLGEDCSATLVCATGLVCNGSTCVSTNARGPAVCVYSAW